MTTCILEWVLINIRSMNRRDEVLAAAAEVFAQHGFRGSTTRRIAEAAGVNEITIFRQFGSKALLLREAMNHMTESAGLAEFPELLGILEEHQYRGFITIERRQSENAVNEIADAVKYLKSL